MSYKFSLIRFVPDPARGEFVNIGAIAGDEESEDWDVRWISNYTRARALDSAGLLSAAKAFTAKLDERVADLPSPNAGTRSTDDGVAGPAYDRDEQRRTNQRPSARSGGLRGGSP